MCHKLLLYLVVIAFGELTKIQECCFYVDYLQGHVVSCCVLWGNYVCCEIIGWTHVGWQESLCKNIIREVIIMRSTPGIWHDLNLLTQTVSGCLTDWWNNSCRDYCVTRMWLPPPTSEKILFSNRNVKFIQLYCVAFSSSSRPTRRHIYPHMHTKLPRYDWKPAGSQLELQSGTCVTSMTQQPMWPNMKVIGSKLWSRG